MALLSLNAALTVTTLLVTLHATEIHAIDGPLFDVQFSPAVVGELNEGDETTVEMNITTVNDTRSVYSLQITPGDPDVLFVTVIYNFAIPDSDVGGSALSNFTIKGEWIGRSTLNFEFINEDTQAVDQIDRAALEVAVVRPYRIVDDIFEYSLGLMIVINNVGFGCKFDWKIAKLVFSRPIAVIIGVCGQYIVLPLISWALIEITGLTGTLAFGLLANGSCPSGGISNVWTMLLGGDITLSLCMTFASNVFAMGGWPLWLLTLGPELLDNDSVDIPFLNIFISLLILAVPLGIGFSLRKCAPKAARFMNTVLKPLSVFLIVFIMSFGVYVNIYALDFLINNWRVSVCSALLPYLGTFLSGLVAFLVGQPWYRAKTVAIETALQNTALTLIMLRYTLPQPEADIASVMPLIGTIFAPLPLIVMGIFRLYKKYCTNELDMEKQAREDEINDSRRDTESVYTLSMNGYVNHQVSNGNIPDGLTPDFGKQEFLY